MRKVHSRYHNLAQQTISNNHNQTLEELESLIQKHDVVVVGMFLNPHVARAKRLLTQHSISFHYQEYGGYFSAWKQRLAIKMWSGWPTFPQVFVRQQLIGGASDLATALQKQEIQRILKDE